ncbi:MAG: uridine kinase [Acidobacteria bacterium]|nr:uridine kinase [Acidobacteriota bacterium]
MQDRPWLVGIVGGSGSGKTSIAQELRRRIRKTGADVLMMDMDAYYAPLELVKARFGEGPINWDHPNAFDLELLALHLGSLRRGESIRKPVYDFQTSDRTGWSEPIAPSEVIILEGLLLFALPELRDQLDLKIFVDTDADVRILRRIQRDMKERGRSLESVVAQYLDSVRPMHLEFVEPSKRWADLIVPTGVENKRALEMLTHHVLGRLQKGGPAHG